MKKLKEYTEQEKIKKFDEIYANSLEEFNESAEDLDEHDVEYFWEDVIENILGLTQGDWDKHNSGEILKE